MLPLEAKERRAVSEGKTERTDAQIRDEMVAQLAQQMPDEAEQVQVDVVDGQATLVGTVDTSELRESAERIVQSVSGVTFVINNLRVAQKGTTGATG